MGLLLLNTALTSTRKRPLALSQFFFPEMDETGVESARNHDILLGYSRHIAYAR